MKNSIKEKPNPDHVIDLKFNFQMISLGEQCYSRVFPERFHLYDFRKTRKVRMPFDGCVTQYKEVCLLFNNEHTSLYLVTHPSKGIRTFLVFLKSYK